METAVGGHAREGIKNCSQSMKRLSYQDCCVRRTKKLACFTVNEHARCLNCQIRFLYYGSDQSYNSEPSGTSFHACVCVSHEVFLEPKCSMVISHWSSQCLESNITAQDLCMSLIGVFRTMGWRNRSCVSDILFISNYLCATNRWSKASNFISTYSAVAKAVMSVHE